MMSIVSLLRRHTVYAALSTLILPGIAFAVLKTDPTKSQVSAIFKQMNVPVEAKFKGFNAQIDFNPAKPEAGKANVEIDVKSFDLGDPTMNQEVLKKEWFNAAQFAKASFVSSAIKPAAGGTLTVSGKLTIKGKSQDISFPLSVKTEGGNQTFEGSLPIRRLNFNIGEGEWKDTSMVADEVVIKFRVVTSQ